MGVLCKVGVFPRVGGTPLGKGVLPRLWGSLLSRVFCRVRPRVWVLPRVEGIL